MRIPFWDLKKGFKFVAPGAGRVEYIVEDFDRNSVSLKRTKDGKMSTLPTDNLLDIINRKDTKILSEQETEKPIGVSMEKELNEIKAALEVTALESGESQTSAPSTTVTKEAPITPYEKMKAAPKGFPMADMSLKPFSDLREANPLMKKIDESAEGIKKIITTISDLEAEYKEKVKKVKLDEKFDEKNQELTDLTNRAAAVIEDQLSEVTTEYGGAKSILLEYQDRVYSIYDNITKTSASDTEKLNMYQQALAKLLSPELVASVTNLVNQGVAEMEKAKTMVKRRFVSFPAQKDIRKQVKEELPKSVGSIKTADFLQSIKDFFSGIWESVKSLFVPIKENASDLMSLLETQVQPVLDETADLVGPTPAIASIKEVLTEA